MLKLSVNVDHIATLREARKTNYPDPVAAAILAELAGANGITVHLREDRRHIKERDVEILRQTIKTKLNLEMGLSDSVVKFALKIRPDMATIVPEKEGEITTEGGLDLSKSGQRLSEVISLLHEAGIMVSLFINPTPNSVRKAHKLNADFIEIHTGLYAEAKSIQEASEEIERIAGAAMLAKKLDLGVNAGHGLNYENVREIVLIQEIDELSIGHSIIARASLVGVKEAVQQMLKLMER
ncbi:pyridoxine 5'-phosphate synthase [Candidatus Aerophobetes bacterium]|nr:pyridoxine 5'-phosphate synthase [Candidatus Aerophobetes bacterium]